MVEAAAKKSSKQATQLAESTGGNVEAARKRAVAAFISENGARLRFDDFRHQAVTELAETSASDGTMMALAGHLSREMLEH